MIATRLRKCLGCGFEFRSLPGEMYCSGICAGEPAQMELLRLLASFPAGRLA